MSATRQRRGKAQSNAQPAQRTVIGDVADAIAYEKAIADRAANVWEKHGAEGMTRELFVKLWPLLTEPIPKGFLVHTTQGAGKPYESDGIRSVQVCHDRMNNVLTPLWWEEHERYEDDARVCRVEILVKDVTEAAIVRRAEWGGVNHASTEGNLRKGSYTNAAKRAFAKLGVGHEVYLGAIDYDPDVNDEVAEEQARRPRQDARRDANGRPPSVDEAEALLGAVLAQDGPLHAKRIRADEGMRHLGAGPHQRLRELQAHGSDERALDALLDRIKNASEGAI